MLLQSSTGHALCHDAIGSIAAALNVLSSGHQATGSGSHFMPAAHFHSSDPTCEYINQWAFLCSARPAEPLPA